MAGRELQRAIWVGPTMAHITLCEVISLVLFRRLLPIIDDNCALKFVILLEIFQKKFSNSPYCPAAQLRALGASSCSLLLYPLSGIIPAQAVLFPVMEME